MTAQWVAENAPEPEEPGAKIVFANVYLTFVCDFLRELQEDDGPERIEAAYLKASREYTTAHEMQAHSGRYELWEPERDRECWEWQLRYAPALKYLPENEPEQQT